MRVLADHEVKMVAGGIAPRKPEQSEEVGNSGAPIHSKTAGGYFTSCMRYTSPSATSSAAWTLVGAVNRHVGAAGVAYAAGQVVVCGIGSIQYAQ